MSRSEGLRQVAWFDCAGGGQVVVEGRFAFIGHMAAPHGTSVVDVADARHPRVVAEIEIPSGLHSHKVRVANGVMIANRERHGGEPAADDFVGLRIFDAADPRRPREICRWTCAGMGVHRFTFDGRYAYISPELNGYIGNVIMILDLGDPARPQEVGRWWMPGQHIAGGEVPSWQGRAHRCHHPIRLGDRLYVSYWHGGAVILDISDMHRPRMVSAIDTSPPYAWPTHSVVPVQQTIAGQRWMVVADEHVAPLASELSPEMPAFLWMMNITDETRPIPVGSFQVAELVGRRNPLMSGCHQPVETITGTEVAAAWFAGGLRIIDISNPHTLRQVAFHVPDPPPGAERPCSNDLCIDDRGLIYLIDRNRGLSILERL